MTSLCKNEFCPSIETHRAIAHQLLRPSQAQQEHGFEIHKHSIVFDAYGFSPTSPVDPTKILKLIHAGGSELEQKDLIEEMSMTRHIHDPQAQECYRHAWDVSGVTCLMQNAGEESSLVSILLKRLSRFIHATDFLNKIISKVIDSENIIALKKENKHGICLATNGIPIPLNLNHIEDEIQCIRLFHQLGVRMMHLTYNRRNLLGDGCMEKNDGGLSDFGRFVISEMNRLGMIIDVSHSGMKTSLEAAQASGCPLIASHTAIYSLNPHPRCKNDSVLHAIADKGGIVGICCVPAFLGKSGDLIAFLDHIDDAVKKIGIDHVAIGTDRGFSSRKAQQEFEKLPKPLSSRPTWESLWLPDDPIFSTIWNQEHQLSSLAWTNWPYFTVGLVQRGYSDGDIQKLIGGNMMRLLKSTSHLKH